MNPLKNIPSGTKKLFAKIAGLANKKQLQVYAFGRSRGFPFLVLLESISRFDECYPTINNSYTYGVSSYQPVALLVHDVVLLLICITIPPV